MYNVMEGFFLRKINKFNKNQDSIYVFTFLLFKASLNSWQKFIVYKQFYYIIVKRFVISIHVEDQVHLKTNASVYCKKYAVMSTCIVQYFLLHNRIYVFCLRKRRSSVCRFG